MPPRSTNKRGGIVFYGTLIATEPEPETPMATTVRPTAAAHPSTSTEVQRVLELIKEKKIQVVDVKFCDLPGTWQHFSIPAASLDEAMIREGLGFDGSSIRGFQGRGVPQDHRYRDHLLLGPRSGILHLQLGAVRPERA